MAETSSTGIQAQAASEAETTRIDILTICAIAVSTFLISTVAHEALGHGLAALLVGLHPTRVTSVDLEVDFTNVAAWKVRTVAAAGCVANLVLSGIGLLLYRTLQRITPGTRFFFWLLATINLLIPGGYMMVLTLIGIGDWNDFVQGLPDQLLWRLALTALGIILSLAGLLWGMRNLDPFLGRDERLRGRRALLLTLSSYLAGSTANTLAGALNPTSPTLILISAAASSFGGTIWLLWINMGVKKERTNTPEQATLPGREWLWLGLGVAALAIYFLILGPGLPRTTLF